MCVIAYFNLCTGLTALPPPVAALPADTELRWKSYLGSRRL
jgi:hypothetical protein